MSTLFTVLLGLPVAYLLARTRLPGRALLETLVTLPTILPPVVAGVALLLAFGRLGLIGRYLDLLGVSLPFTTAAVVMAQIFVSAPFFITGTPVSQECLCRWPARSTRLGLVDHTGADRKWTATTTAG